MKQAMHQVQIEIKITIIIKINLKIHIELEIMKIVKNFKMKLRYGEINLDTSCTKAGKWFNLNHNHESIMAIIVKVDCLKNGIKKAKIQKVNKKKKKYTS